MLFGFSLYFVFFNVHVYGNIVGLSFGLIALYFTLQYLENKKPYNFLIIGISIAISILLKSNYNIFLCGIVLTLALEFFKDKKLRNKFVNVAGILVVLGSYLIAKSGFQYYVENKARTRIA